MHKKTLLQPGQPRRGLPTNYPVPVYEGPRTHQETWNNNVFWLS